MIFAAAMSTLSGEFNSLATASMVDFYKRFVRPDGGDAHDLLMSRVFTAFWGVFACLIALQAGRLGSAIEVVNRFGSYFYGSILGVFAPRHPHPAGAAPRARSTGSDRGDGRGGRGRQLHPRPLPLVQRRGRGRGLRGGPPHHRRVRLVAPSNDRRPSHVRDRGRVRAGRLGAGLRLFQAGHQVAVIDEVGTSFENLHPDYRGRTIEGEVLSEEVLKRAGIETADGLAAVTNSDSVNAVVGHVARTVYKVPQRRGAQLQPALAAHAPRLRPAGGELHGLGRAADRGAAVPARAGRAVFSAGNGEVEIYEVVVPAAWAARRCRGPRWADGVRGRRRHPRPGARCCPRRRCVLEPGDVLHVSATPTGMDALRGGRARGRRNALMFVLIAGGGRTGAQLATFLVSQRHEVRLIEHRPEILAHIHRELPTEVVFHGNATDPDVLERAGAPARPGAGRLHARRRRQPGPVLRRAHAATRSRAPSPPSTTRATPGSSTSASTWTWPSTRRRSWPASSSRRCRWAR